MLYPCAHSGDDDSEHWSESCYSRNPGLFHNDWILNTVFFDTDYNISEYYCRSMSHSFDEENKYLFGNDRENQLCNYWLFHCFMLKDRVHQLSYQ